MRQLTESEISRLDNVWNNHLETNRAGSYLSFEAGFIAGLEYQDKRIEALTDMLKAAGVSENIINGVLSHVDSLR